jgi:hypothetical protein
VRGTGGHPIPPATTPNALPAADDPDRPALLRDLDRSDDVNVRLRIKLPLIEGQRHRRTRSASALLVALALVGCGSQTDQQQIRNVVNRFNVDAPASNWTDACPLTTGGFRSLCRLIATPTCPSTPEAAMLICDAGAQDAVRLAGLNGLKIANVAISGSTATVTFQESTEVIKLRKTQAGWLIDSA